MPSASEERDRAIAQFFKVAAELLELCKPLLKEALKGKRVQ